MSQEVNVIEGNKLKQKKKQNPELDKILEHMEKYREMLYESKSVSSTRFNHMQTAIHGCKNIVRDHFGVPREGDTAWVK